LLIYWLELTWIGLALNDLGVIIIMDEKMNFSEHLDVMVGKRLLRWWDLSKTVIRVQRSIHSEVSLHVFGSSEAAVGQLCIEPII
jgi:hypothetical protein